MGLLNKLTKEEGSVYSNGNGKTPATNILATQQSKMHANGSQPGYSLDGAFYQDVNQAFQGYNDGTTNILPQPSVLDLNGRVLAKYTDNLPG